MKNHIPDKDALIGLSYDEFLERLKIEIGNFLSRAERGKINKHQGFKSRASSMRLRELLKMYRRVSLKQERIITNVIQESKKRAEEQLTLDLD